MRQQSSVSPPRGLKAAWGGGLSAKHGPLETPGMFWGAPQPVLTRADLALCLVHDELVRGHAEIAGALRGGDTRRSTVGAGRALSCPPPTLQPPLTTAAAVSRAMEAQLRTRVRSPQHSILRGEGGEHRGTAPRGGAPSARPPPGHSHGEEAAGALGQPQAAQQADGEDEDEEEEVSQPPGGQRKATISW